MIDTADRFLHSPYRVVRRSIDAGHGWSCPDEYEVANDAHSACRVGNQYAADWLAGKLNELRVIKLNKGKH